MPLITIDTLNNLIKKFIKCTNFLFPTIVSNLLGQNLGITYLGMGIIKCWRSPNVLSKKVTPGHQWLLVSRFLVSSLTTAKSAKDPPSILSLTKSKEQLRAKILRWGINDLRLWPVSPSQKDQVSIGSPYGEDASRILYGKISHPV